MWGLFLLCILCQNLGHSQGLKCWICFNVYDDTTNDTRLILNKDWATGDPKCRSPSTLDPSEDLIDCSDPAVGAFKDAHMYCYTEQVRSIDESNKYLSINRGCKFFPPERTVGCTDIADENYYENKRRISGDSCTCDTDKCNGADFIPPEPIFTCHANCDLKCFECDFDNTQPTDIQCSVNSTSPVILPQSIKCDKVVPLLNAVLNDRKPKHVVYACGAIAWKRGDRELIRRRCMGLLIDKANLNEIPRMGCKKTKMPGGYLVTEYLCDTSECNKDLANSPPDCHWFQQISPNESDLSPQPDFVWPEGTFPAHSKSNPINLFKPWIFYVLLLYAILT